VVDKSDTLLRIDGLSVWYKVYEGILRVLNEISLHVNHGDRVGLVGEAGCGKTTLLKTIAMILPAPASQVPAGSVCLRGIDILRDRGSGLRAIRKDVSMIFQDPTASLNPTLTIRSFMSDILKSQLRRSSRRERNRVMLEALDKVSMPSPDRVLDSYPIQLSGGMRQRVCIAMTLLKDADLILADEPTTSLDVTIEEQILELLNDLVIRGRKSMILVSHALGAVRKMTDHVCVMYAGEAAEIGATQSVFNEPAHPYTQSLFEATPKLSGEGISNGIAGEIPSYLNPPQGCRFAPRCPSHLPSCDEAKPPFFRSNGKQDVACYLYESSGKSTR